MFLLRLRDLLASNVCCPFDIQWPKPQQPCKIMQLDASKFHTYESSPGRTGLVRRVLDSGQYAYDAMPAKRLDYTENTGH